MNILCLTQGFRWLDVRCGTATAEVLLRVPSSVNTQRLRFECSAAGQLEWRRGGNPHQIDSHQRGWLLNRNVQRVQYFVKSFFHP